MKYFVIICILIISLSGISCNSSKITRNQISKEPHSINSKLLERLGTISKAGFAFGQQDGTAYGLNWYLNDGSVGLNSDLKKVTGKLPAVIGFDLGHLEHDNIYNLDTVAFALIKQQTIEINRLGGIVSYSWHADNPVSKGSSWDTTEAVHDILYDERIKNKFNLWIERLSIFFKSLKDDDNQFIPVIFRPFHEMNGSWFWWGKKNCTKEDYVELWRYTVERFKYHGVQNLIYAFSPNTMNDVKDFDDYYPGDDYVDILGVDIYNHSGNTRFIESLNMNLSILKRKSEEKDMPFALTETGNMRMGSDSSWWTETLYPALHNSGITWVLVWRNARRDHYFGTFPGEKSAPNFKKFTNYPDVLMLSDLH